MRTVHAARPYFFEVFSVLNFVAVVLALRPLGLSPFMLLGTSFVRVLPTLLVQLLIGAGVRYAMRRRAYLDEIRSGEWLLDTVRLLLFSVVWVHLYGWIKIAVPLLTHKLYDDALARAGRLLLFGHSPEVFAVTLFSNPVALRLFDWSYANVFFASLVVAGAYFYSSPDRRLRIGFMNANATMWLVGAWLYVAFPALGPAYAFPEVWLPFERWLPQTQFLQRLLMTNYQHVLQLPKRAVEVNLLFGVAAFPSLHVAFEWLVFLWMYRISHAGRVAFALSTLIIAIGSLVTGWHHFVDAIAGILLATLCWAAFQLLPLRLRRHATVVG